MLKCNFASVLYFIPSSDNQRKQGSFKRMRGGEGRGGEGRGYIYRCTPKERKREKRVRGSYCLQLPFSFQCSIYHFNLLNCGENGASFAPQGCKLLQQLCSILSYYNYFDPPDFYFYFFISGRIMAVNSFLKCLSALYLYNIGPFTKKQKYFWNSWIIPFALY